MASKRVKSRQAAAYAEGEPRPQSITKTRPSTASRGTDSRSACDRHGCASRSQQHQLGCHEHPLASRRDAAIRPPLPVPRGEPGAIGRMIHSVL